LSRRRRLVKKGAAKAKEEPQVKRLKARVRNLMTKLSESVPKIERAREKLRSIN